MSTQYGLPLFLEDATGIITRTEFSDLYDRIHISIAPSSSSTARVAIRSSARSCADCIIDLPQRIDSKSASITFAGSQTIPIENYLKRVRGAPAYSPARKFVASDSQSYTWAQSPSASPDPCTSTWTCKNEVTGQVIADYSFNDATITGSKCAAILTVEEGWNCLLVELLATLTIVRHIAKNKL
ncbi:hypothetical protein FRC02_007322 [Tulasnella sp. 418]|nr:hypothetical protein FRC02_007322 [Tulasnella sp. 418]